METKIRVQEIGKEIADQIEERGHYQGEHAFGSGYCVLTAPAFPASSFKLQDQIASAIYDRIGYPTNYLFTSGRSLGEVVVWNDSTPTAEVLNVLRSL